MEGNVLKRQRAAGLWESFNFCQLSAFDTFTGALLPRVQTPNRAATSKTCHLSPQAAFPASLRRDRCTDGGEEENTPSSDSEGCVLPQPRDNPVSHLSSVSSFLKKEAAPKGRDRSVAICRAQPSKSFLSVKCEGEIRWRQALGEIGSSGRQRGSETKS